MSEQLAHGADVIPLKSDDKPVLFISHRHDDKAIADALRKFVQTWTSGRIEVVQTSSADAEGPKQGKNLNQELRRSLWHAGVVVLIYTNHEQDWSYCMWECGVAQLPEPSNTRTVVLQCLDQFPDVFADQLHVGLRNEQEIEKFVNELFTDATYFPKLGRPVTDFSAGTQLVKDAAHDLYTELQKVLPTRESADDEWPGYPQLTIELTDDQLARIHDAQGSNDEKLATARQVIVEEAVVIGGDSQIGSVFGVNGFPRKPPASGVPVRKLVESWRSSSPTPSSGWIDDMCRQIRATVNNDLPAVRWQLMRGADGENTTWYGPIVRYFKRIPARRCTEIDVVFCKFRLGDDKRPRIELCEVESDDD